MSSFLNLEDAIRNDPRLGPRFREIEAEEVQVAAAVPDVMLDIAFSPVLLHPGETTADAVTVDYEGDDGRFVITRPKLIILTREECQLARARYLIVNGKEKQPFIDALMGKGRL